MGNNFKKKVLLSSMVPLGDPNYHNKEAQKGEIYDGKEL
jgi:hypothetical protein